MDQIVFLFLLEIVAVIQASKPRSVNVALETVLEFDNKDDVEFIETMQKFLDKLKSTITKNRDDYNENKNGDKTKRFIFTDFLADTITVLKSYGDDDLKTFFLTLEREIKSWQTRKEFHEIADKLGFRGLIDSNLHRLRNSPVDNIRRDLSHIIDKIKLSHYNANSGFVANFLNYIYKKESEAHLMKFLNNLKLYRTRTRRSNMTDLKRLIRNGIISFIDPLLKLNPATLKSIGSLFKIDTNNETQDDNGLRTHVKIHKINFQQSGEKREYKEDIVKDNEILDYIEDHIKVIDSHITSKGLKIKAKIKSLPRLKNTRTTKKHIHTTRKNRKLKSKLDNLERIVNRPREKKKQRRLTHGIKNLEETKDNNNDKKTVLINLASDNIPELKAVEEYLSITKRNKMPTRPRLTSRRPQVSSKTTKYRKAFRSSTLSAEGLSIEHFGSLFGREFHRKNNNNDTFAETVANSSLSTVSVDLTTKDGSDIISKEIRRSNNVSGENEENLKQNFKTKNVSEEVVDNKTIETVNEKRNLVTESIKIKGNIIIENPTKSTTLSEVEATSAMPVRTTTFKDYNVSIVTKYFNVQPMKPTLIFRSHDEVSNETAMSSVSTTAQIKPTVAETIFTKVENDKNIKPNEDGLENEIEGIRDRYNSTPMAEKFENLINVQANDEKGNKVRDQMKADLAKMLATPTTKSTVTELFTDPFDDIDDTNADLL